MNYRHAFHAGNFADVFKHVVLCRILHHLCVKPAAFRVIDTHAGAGLYDLASPEAQRGGEWRDGIARLRDAVVPPAAAALMAPYRRAVDTFNASSELATYPGSPAIARTFLRAQDRLLACEAAPQPAAALARHLRADARVKVLARDGWTALSAYVPPVERRGLVLVDPPYEDAADFRRLSDGLATAYRRWATGIYLLWYPIKTRTEPDLLAKRLRRSGIARIVRAEISVAPLADPSRLNGCGLIIVNPPWTLERELTQLLPSLSGILGREKLGTFRLDRLAGEAGDAP